MDDFYFNITDDASYDMDLYDLRPLDFDLEDQNIIGIRIGDVDGSWISDVQARKSIDEEFAYIHVDSNELLSIPVAIKESELIEGIELMIKEIA